ncbi:MAG: tetraacyldisaccharide 4'-kinase [Candidatus Omnitrophica bacterium]|nr:tetraacyldisaccharide 4'-kinase [Candidatus Omnitrophota bacterium]
MKGITHYLTRIAQDRERGLVVMLLSPLVWFLSGLYAVAVLIMRGLYQAGALKVFRAPVPVISVGNITAGGTGKTPFVVMLYKLLKDQGFSPMILTRGYMAGQTGPSDEAEMLKDLIGPVVFIGSDRVKSFRSAFVSGRFDCIILDDGFQQWGFKKDLDIVMIDAEAPFGNGALIPRGILREPLSALSSASMVVLSKTERVLPQQLGLLKKRVATLAPEVVLAVAAQHVSGVRELFSGVEIFLTDIAGPAGAFCAIGAPDNFKRTLDSLGVEVKLFVAFADHYRFNGEDVQTIVEDCRALGVRNIFITHKDAGKVKAVAGSFAGIRIMIVDIDVVLTYGKTEFISSIAGLHRS